ncbi:MAG: ATP-binding cassette domain-containing protein, partial [Methanobrevibacter sp.]|nr:ATP-binding cassette domain-containing protein [Methanobrevibacter sp.]
LKDGKIEFVDNAHNICSEVIDDEIFENYLPAVTKIYNSLSVKYPSLIKLNTPLSIREGRRCLGTIRDDLIKISNGDEESNNLDSANLHHINKKYNSQEKSGIIDKLPFNRNKDALIQMKGIYFAYEKENLILKNVDFDLNKGDFLSLIGGNGVGKSTFLQLLVGILKPIKGKVKYKKGINLAYVHQNPMIHFSKDNVREEFMESILESNLLNRNGIGFSGEDYEKLLKMSSDEFIGSDILNGLKFDSIDYNFKELIEFFDITNLIDKHPYDCSGGEQQKIVIVKALLQNADVLILDEPTKGLDPLSSKALADILNSLRDNGLTILMTSHDLDFVANNCKRCLMLFDKDIQIDDDPKVIFAENNFYTTFVNRMVKEYVPEIVTLEDLKSRWDLE